MSSEPFDQKQAEFLQCIINGGTWRSARKEISVGNSTISGWLKDDPEFREQYARACDIRADAIFEEILEIADDGANDWMMRNHGETVAWVENGEALRRSALRIETRKWQDKDGQDRYSTEIVLRQFGGVLTLLDSTDRKGTGEDEGFGGNTPPGAPVKPCASSDMDDDIPFAPEWR